jgi:hypothetical protein
MATTNLSVINDEPTAQNRAQAATESYNTRSGKTVSQLVPARKGLRLDVDEVLARSLPTLTGKDHRLGEQKNPARI